MACMYDVLARPCDLADLCRGITEISACCFQDPFAGVIAYMYTDDVIAWPCDPWGGTIKCCWGQCTLL